MKIFSTILLPFIVLGCAAQNRIPADSASAHIGDSLTVCGKVFGTRFLEASKDGPTFLNIGAEYPKSPFTVVILLKDRKKFKEAPEDYFKGKNVCVLGKIIDFKGKAEIVVTEPEQISVEEK